MVVRCSREIEGSIAAGFVVLAECLRLIRCHAMQKNLDPNQLADSEDWWGNNIAFKCPVCRKVFLVGAHMKGGERNCPKCGKSKGMVSGGK